MMQLMKKIIILATTIVEPTGVENRIDTNIPDIAQHTEIIAEQITTPLKLCMIRIEDSAGKIMSAEINKEPTKFIAKTIIIAVTTAINRL